METINRLMEPGVLFFLIVILGVLFYLTYSRHRESARIIRMFKRDHIIMTSFAATFFGLESEPGSLLRRYGSLVLLKEGLYYRARFHKKSLFVPGSAITFVGVTDTLKGKPLNQNAVVIYFLNRKGKEDRAVFAVPFPSHWISAIKSNLLNREIQTQVEE